jgi:hypothetical protein
MTLDNRRIFFRQILGLGAAAAAQGAVRPKGASGDAGGRQETALQIRQDDALAQSQAPAANHPDNGDETSLPGFIASFTKGLPHTPLGEVQPGSYETLLNALSTAKPADFANITRGLGTKFVNPQAAYSFQMEGADSHRLGMAPAPAFASADAAGEMVELYWQALARDVPFTAYDTSPVTQAAIADLNRLSAFHGPTAGGQVTTGALFRGNVQGGLNGPYVSQFLWKPVPVNSTNVDQRFRVPAAGIDYLASFPDWLSSQSGAAPARSWQTDPTPRYISNGRGLAEWVHFDFLYQAFHNAGLILLNQGPDTYLLSNPYLNPTNPYKSATMEAGFVTFGAPHICTALGTVAEMALQAAWFQKWLVHRRLRPEVFGGRVHQTKTGAAQYPVHSDLLNSAALKAVFSANGSYLLSQSFPEGSPLHPSYPSGHATVAGACSAMLKAFFDENAILADPVVASADGLSLAPYSGAPLTVGGEINKLAFNVAMGRDFAGIHYRSDAEGGMRLGEDVAIAMLQDLVNTFNENFSGFAFTRFDGTPVQVCQGCAA